MFEWYCYRSGKTINDFQTTIIEGKKVYTYKGKIVVAAATEELFKTGYSKNRANVRQTGKHYYNYYDEIKLCINGNTYDAIVLDSCGAAMWDGGHRIDLFVPSSSDVISASNVKVNIC